MDGAPFFDGTQPCSEYDVDVFIDYVSLAKTVCDGTISLTAARCPFIEACADYAIPRPWLYGVWGGLGHSTRERVRRNAKIPPIQREWE